MAKNSKIGTFFFYYVAITRVKKHLFIVSADDINRLSAWYQIKKNSYPKDLKCKNSLRFLYEGNLVESENYLENFGSLENTDIKNKIIKRYHQKVSKS
jgi:DNA helicase-2/ATP-dependent DNA helicase PcrA